MKLLDAILSALLFATVVGGEQDGAPEPGMYLDWRDLDGERPFLARLPPSDLGQLPPRTVAAYTGVPDAEAPTQDLRERRSACALFLTKACRDWWSQRRVPLKPYPRGSKECLNNCNGKGNCNYDIGECQCTVGFTGRDCATPERRPCSHRFAQPDDSDDEPIGDASLTTPGWTMARCAGVCDETMGLCYCGYGSKHARVPAPAGSPWGTPPIQKGLALAPPCQPRTGPDGKNLLWGGYFWGSRTWEELYGASGYCNAPNKPHQCSCVLANLHGPECDVVSEAWCPNQCNLRGECVLGFCKCEEGWYGTACDKLKAGASFIPALESKKSNESQGWLEKLKEVWKEPIHSVMPWDPARLRRRPLIYVYDLPPEFNVRQVQLRTRIHYNTWRRFTSRNTTETDYNHYMLENYLHETLLSSPQRTLDPEEADFFYVPVYLSWYFWQIVGWSDGPWFGQAKAVLQPYHMMWMMLKAKRWVQQTYPYWNRSRGADHIFMPNHDEGACYMANELYENAIMFTHWGRTDLIHKPNHATNSGHYNEPLGPGWLRRYNLSDWRDMWRGHRCYTPGKDLIIPALKTPLNYPHTPLLGAPLLEKDILLYFKGDCGHDKLWWYSRGIRQTLFRLAHDDDWWAKYRIRIVEHGPDVYSEALARSKFCLVAPGHGWSARAEDAIVHGCIPVVIQDGVEMIFHDILDWDQFSVRIAQRDTKRLPQILLSLTDAHVEAKQRALSKVWSRFFYATGPWHKSNLPDIYSKAHKQYDPALWSGHMFAPMKRYPVHEDALHTIMQWLYGRMPYVSQRYKREHGNNKRSAA